MSIGAAVTSFEHDGRKVNMIDTPGRAELRRRHARGAAGRRRGGLRRQRGDGGRGPHRAALAARRRGGSRAAGVRQHARPRAGRLLPLPRVAEVGVRPARGRDRDPDRLRARGPRGDRPDRHDRVRVQGRRSRQREADRDPRGAPRAGRGVPREAHGRGRRELRRADGALPRGRGDLTRGDRRGAEEGGERGSPVPGHLRRRDPEPGHQPAARGAGRGPALAGDARARSRRSTPTTSRSRSSPTRPASRSPTSSRPRPTPTPGGSTCCASTRGCSPPTRTCST